MSDGDDSSAGFDGAKLLTGGLALVSTATGLVGTLSGAIPRLIRNNPGYFLWTVVLIIVAIALSFAASEMKAPSATTTELTVASATTSGKKLPGTIAQSDQPKEGRNEEVARVRKKLSARPPRSRVVLSFASLMLFALSVVVLVNGLTASVGAGDQPRLSANWTFPTGAEPLLTVHMQLDNLKADQTVYINVTPLGAPISDTVYRSQTGADVDGTADETFDVPLPSTASGLQVVASVNAALSCDGAPISAIPVATTVLTQTSLSSTPADRGGAGTASKGSPLDLNPPVAASTSVTLQPPVTSSSAAPLEFSCIQLSAPAPVPQPSTSTSPAQSP